jgi:hypothetical protein
MALAPEALLAELEIARRGGSMNEIDDLSLLLQNAERPKGSPKIPGAAQAANRQAQRRYNRTHTRDQNSAKHPDRRKPVPGDYVRVPNGEHWLVTSLVGTLVRSDDQPGCLGMRCCPIGMVTIVDGPAVAPSPTPVATPAPSPVADATETLYHACWDALDRAATDLSAPPLSTMLETALRAYEASLA